MPFDVVKESPIFHKVDKAYLQEWLTQNNVQTFGDNDFIITQGEQGHGMYLILEGEVEILIEDKNHPQEKILLSMFKPGDCFGEICMFITQARTASARAKGNVKVIYLDATKLQNEIENRNLDAMKIGLNIASILADHLRRTNELIVEYNKQTHPLNSQSEISQFKTKLAKEFLI